MIFFVFIALSLYLVFAVVVLYGWSKLSRIKTETTEMDWPFVSVIVAFRNEKKNLENLLKDLKNQEYPSSLYEIILVNDHSEDAGEEYIKRNIGDNIRLISCTDNEKGKKAAINKGIKISLGDVCIITDADCRLQSSWLREMILFKLTVNLVMVLGPVRMTGKNNILGQLQKLDFLCLSVVTGGMAAIGKPIMCNAANMGFNRSHFLEIDPFEKNKKASGDDVFLLLSLKKQPGNKIAFLKRNEVIVDTSVQESFSDFFHQRLRWASKNSHLADIDSYLILFVIVLANGALLLSFFYAFSGRFLLFMIVLIVKLIADSIIIYKGNRFFQYRLNFPVVLFMEFLYPFYVFIIGFISFFFNYKWKNRVVK